MCVCGISSANIYLPAPACFGIDLIFEIRNELDNPLVDFVQRQSFPRTTIDSTRNQLSIGEVAPRVAIRLVDADAQLLND